MCNHTNISIKIYFLSNPLDNIAIKVYNIIKERESGNPKNRIERKYIMKREGTEIVKVNGISFRIGYLTESEFSGYVFEMKKNGSWYGVLMVSESERELGYESGIFATDDELAAIKIAGNILSEKYGKHRIHG